MKKYLFIILFLFSGVAIFAGDNVEHIATTLGDGETPTVGTNLLLNIKPRASVSASSWEDLTGTDGGSSISIIGGQVKKTGTASSGGASGVAGAGISNFNSGRSSSVSSGTASVSSDANGGPRKAGGWNPGGGDWDDPYKTPVGAMPVVFMLLLALGYGLYRKLGVDISE